MVRIVKQETERGDAAEELPAEIPEPCFICAHPRGIVKIGTLDINKMPLDLRKFLEDNSLTEPSTSRSNDHRGRAQSVCNSCFNLLSQIMDLHGQGRTKVHELITLWENSKYKKTPGNARAFVKAELGNKEDAWNGHGDIVENLRDLEMEDNDLEEDFFQDSDRNSYKRKRSSNHCSWDKMKLASPKCLPSAPHQTENSKTSLSPPYWTCYFCDNIFYDKYSAEEHHQQMHRTSSSNGAEVLPLNIKNVRESNMPATEHQDNHDSRRYYPCPICNMRFEHSFSLLQHLGNINNIIMCSICFVGCGSIDELEIHQNAHRSRAPGPKCTSCHEIFTDNIFYEYHKPYCSNRLSIGQYSFSWKGSYSCRFCKRTDIQRDEIYEHLLSHRGLCRLCFHNFEAIHGLPVHSAQAHQTTLYNCIYCPDRFTSWLNLHDHMNSHGSGDIDATIYRTLPQQPKDSKTKKITCKECGSSFYNFIDLHKHLDYSHDQRKLLPLQASTSIRGRGNKPNSPANNVTASCENSKTDEKHKLWESVDCGNSYMDKNRLKFHKSEMHKGMKQEAGSSPPSLMSADNKSAIQRLQYFASTSQNVERQANANERLQLAQGAHTKSPMYVSKIPLYCDQCSFSTTDSKGLKVHKGRMHPKREGNSRSQPHTPKISRSSQQRTRLNYYTNQPEIKYRPAEPMVTRLNTVISQESWQCPRCSRVFQTKRGLSQHLSWHNKKDAQATAAANKHLQQYIVNAAIGNPQWNAGGILTTVAKQEEARARMMWHGGEILANISNQEGARTSRLWDAAGGMLAPFRSREEVQTRTMWHAGGSLTVAAGTAGSRKQEQAAAQPRVDADNKHQIFHHPWETPAPTIAAVVKQDRQNKDSKQTYETVVVSQNSSPYLMGKPQESSGMSERTRFDRVLRKRLVSEDASWKCNKCKKHFKSKTLYLEHKKSHAFGGEQFASNSSYGNINLQPENEILPANVYNLLSEQMHKCPICQDMFFLENELEIHKKGHKTNPKESYPDGGKFHCLYCNMRVKGVKAYVTHVATHGRKALNSISNSIQPAMG